MLRALVLLACLCWAAPAWALPLSDPAYVEGYGKNTTGGAGQATCTVTSSASSGAGSFDSCANTYNGNQAFINLTVQFAVSTFSTNQRYALLSNVTIDGCANGQTGVTQDQSLGTDGGFKGWLIQEVGNVIVRCINFRGQGKGNVENGSTLNGSVSGGETTLPVVSTANFNDPVNWGHALAAWIGPLGAFTGNRITYTGISGNSLTGVSGLTANSSGTAIYQAYQAEDNFLWIGPNDGVSTVANVLIDRCTFYQPMNKAWDVTGGGTIRNVTLQRNLFMEAAVNTLVKYTGATLSGTNYTVLTAPVTAGASSIAVGATSAFPASGTAWIASTDRFTYTGKTSNTLTGIPASGTDAVSAHSGVESVLPDIGATRKYALSFHHNVYAHMAERAIGQIKDNNGLPGGDVIDPTNAGPVELVNNINFTSSTTPVVGYFNANYPDGGITNPYALRIWNTATDAEVTGTGRAGGPDTGDGNQGSATMNVMANYFIGDQTLVEVRTDLGATDAGVYISADNTWTVAGQDPNHNYYFHSPSPSAPGSAVLPFHTINAVPGAFQITNVLAPSQFTSLMLPYIGSPNRTALDTQRLNEVAAQLPGGGATPSSVQGAVTLGGTLGVQ